ncbi:hypothetical protein CNMCM7691_000776 [Aspergillus felis]|uniref:Cyanovirin-N domain-containing protein n=1 Tax=Aspergillus felis TaxID=1287682 RepID=A0A8H6V8I0_9EURO|nr:hypothetical protein CNMCM7691_000776 [Aspergillus felis]
MSDSVGHRIKDDRLEGKSTLHYKGLKNDKTWTADQTLNLDKYFGDSDGYFVTPSHGYAEKAKDAEEIREYVDEKRPDEPKLRAHLLRNNGEYRYQGVVLDDYFDVDDDGKLQYL